MRTGQTKAFCSDCGTSMTVIDSVCYGKCLGCVSPSERKEFITLLEERRTLKHKPKSATNQHGKSTRNSRRSTEPEGIEGIDYFLV